MTDIGITHHAIDRASERFLNTWKQMRVNEHEGLASWLKRFAAKAWTDGTEITKRVRTRGHQDDLKRISYMGMTFVFKVQEDGRVKLTTLIKEGIPK